MHLHACIAKFRLYELSNEHSMFCSIDTHIEVLSAHLVSWWLSVKPQFVSNMGGVALHSSRFLCFDHRRSTSRFILSLSFCRHSLSLAWELTKLEYEDRCACSLYLCQILFCLMTQWELSEIIRGLRAAASTCLTTRSFVMRSLCDIWAVSLKLGYVILTG
jgi:hypothetical protein